MEAGVEGLLPSAQAGLPVPDAANGTTGAPGTTSATLEQPHDSMSHLADSATTTIGSAEEPRKRRHKWGPPAAGEFANVNEQKPKKRRSRWEDSTELIVPTAKSGAVIIPGQIPREVTICGGAVKVCSLLQWAK